MVSVRSITLLGHKDHGKSTLVGNLLMLTKSVTQTRINEAKTYSKRLHKGFEPAFILDSFHEEREGGLTIDITRAEIPYKNVAFSLIDVPGHEELIKNMISGASYANTALLLVSVQKDEGIRDQTKRHLFIAKMLGIDHLVVAVNKMDTIGYDQNGFKPVENVLGTFIEKIGFERKNVKFVPVSAYKGDNLVQKSSKMKWYKGKPLLELLYEGSKGNKVAAGSLRLIVQGFLGQGKELIVGRIARGKLSVGDKISIVPSGIIANVSSIVVKGSKVKTAKDGENVAVQLSRKVGRDIRGSVICLKSDSPTPKDNIKALIFVTGKLNKSSNIRFNGITVECNSIKPLKYIDVTTGNESSVGKIEPLGAITAEVKLASKIPAESFNETKELGRFVIYSNNEFSGIGIVK